MPDTEPIPGLVTLDYARHRDRRRYWKWVAIFAGFILAGFGGWKWRSQVTVMYRQWQCATYAPEPAMVVYETNSVAAKVLLQQPGYIAAKMEVVSGANGLSPIAWPSVAEHRPAAWDDYLRITGLNAGTTVRGGAAVGAICFLGELTSPGGQRRLIVVECTPRGPASTKPGFEPGFIQASTILPGTLTKPPGGLLRMGTAAGLVNDRSQLPANLRIFAGQRDPGDPSHFTIRYEVWGKQSMVDGRLDDAGNVALMLQHPRPLPPDYAATNPTQ